MSRNAELTRALADFIKDNAIDCEIFSPKNLRFATLDEERLLPTLYFEDNSGCKGRIRQNHDYGPLMALSQTQPQKFI